LKKKRKFKPSFDRKGERKKKRGGKDSRKRKEKRG